MTVKNEQPIQSTDHSYWNRECCICAHKWAGRDDDACPSCNDGAKTPTTGLLDEVIAAETAHTATSMEIRLGMEVASLRSRNATLDTLAHRLEGEIRVMAAEIERLRDQVAASRADLEGAASNRFYDQRDAYFEGVKDGR